jgi:hypothetical protein
LKSYMNLISYIKTRDMINKVSNLKKK